MIFLFSVQFMLIGISSGYNGPFTADYRAFCGVRDATKASQLSCILIFACRLTN